MLASYSAGRTWDKNCWYHSISRTGTQHTALTSSAATEDKSLISIFLFISLTLTVSFPPKLKDQLLKSLIEIAKLPSHLFLSFRFFLNSAFLWLFELKKIWKERWTISRMPQAEAHYLWLLNDKSWNGFESRQDKRLVLNVTFDFNGLEQKPSFYAVQIAL